MPNDTDGKDGADVSVADEGIGLEDARAMLGELVLRAGYGNERVPILRKGKLTAFLIGVRDHERLRSLDASTA